MPEKGRRTQSYAVPHPVFGRRELERNGPILFWPALCRIQGRARRNSLLLRAYHIRASHNRLSRCPTRRR